jgi:hypothetical protein
MKYYNEGDKLLVLLKNNNTKHIVEVCEGYDNTNNSYTFKCLYGYYYNFHHEEVDINDIDIIQKVTNIEIDAFRKENNIKFKIDDYVEYGSRKEDVDVIEVFDTSDNLYLLTLSNDWVYEGQLKLFVEKEVIKCKIGDKILVDDEGLKHILKVVDIRENENECKVKCLYGDYRKFEDEWFELKNFNTIQKVTDIDIDDFLKENNIKYRIGDKVIFDGENQTILSYDFSDEEYLFEETCVWVSENQINQLNKYSVEDIILVEHNVILQITDIDDTDDAILPYKVICLYGKYSEYHGGWIYRDEIIKSLDKEELESLLIDLDIKYRIGQKLFLKGRDEVKVLNYDTNDEKYYIKSLNNNFSWVDESDLFKHNFRQGDLLKFKENPKTIVKVCSFCSNGDIIIVCVIGNYSIIEDQYYSGNEFERATQAEVDILQKYYLFKIGEKVLYGEDGTEDYIDSIDTSDSNLPYRLVESFDYVSEGEISKIGEKVEEVLVISSIKDSKIRKPTTISKDEEVTEIKPKRRLLLG